MLTKRLTIADCYRTRSLTDAALFLTTKVAFNYRVGYVAGPDGHTFWQYAAHLDRHVRRLQRCLLAGALDLQPYRKVVKRIKTKTRDIYLGNWDERIIDRWLNDCLCRLLDKWYSPNSYAYRISRAGIDLCQYRLLKMVGQNAYVAKRDITSYFYRIDHELLLNKLAGLIDPADYLYKLLEQRVRCQYLEDDELKVATIGVPFGSPIACTLANIYLTDLDHEISRHPVGYSRYADDFIIIGATAECTRRAAQNLDDGIGALKLELKPSHSLNYTFQTAADFKTVSKFKHLGVEFTSTGTVRLAIEKQRKIVNFFKRAANSVSLKRIKGLGEKLRLVVECVNDVINDRIRSVAIIDYYLKHVTDELQLKVMDRLIAEMVIATVLGKKFRKRDFRTIPFRRLRQIGLISLRHRHRLLKHGIVRTCFLSMYNHLMLSRYLRRLSIRQERINSAKLLKKLKKANPQSNP